MTMLGNISGLFIMSLLSVLGLSAIIFHSAIIFITVKFAGAAYLIFLGVQLCCHGFSGKNRSSALLKNTKSPALINLYWQGLFVALSNPKAIAFTTALFSQFIEPTQQLLPQFLLLVITFMVLSLGCLLAYGYAAENIKNRSSALKASGYLSKAFGSAFIVSGVALVGTSQK